MVTVEDFSNARSVPCPSSISSRPPASSIFVNALMSAPAQNSSGLAEAKISARIASSPSTASHTDAIALMTSGDSELAGGLFSHAIA